MTYARNKRPTAVFLSLFALSQCWSAAAFAQSAPGPDPARAPAPKTAVASDAPPASHTSGESPAGVRIAGGIVLGAGESLGTALVILGAIGPTKVCAVDSEASCASQPDTGMIESGIAVMGGALIVGLALLLTHDKTTVDVVPATLRATAGATMGERGTPPDGQGYALRVRF